MARGTFGCATMPGAAAGQLALDPLVDVDRKAARPQLQAREQAAHRAADHDGPLVFPDPLALLAGMLYIVPTSVGGMPWR